MTAFRPIDTNETRDDSPSIEEKVAFLSRPQSYPATPPHVQVVETHMSWVFLTDRHAYKLKKPVRYDHLDFSTLEARRQDCTEEVRLNRRLAANVYYDGIVPLTVDSQGDLHLSEDGKIVDWLVKMRRLPAHRMLDYAIRHHTVRESDMRKVAALLIQFYTQAPPVAITPARYRQGLADDVSANGHELSLPAYALSKTEVASITQGQLALLEQDPALFDARVHAGKIIEAHGDLRPEHICLERQPVIIDCLEFNRELRILDIVSELAFLTLECERLGAPQVGNLILEMYGDATGDWPPQRLLQFYKSYHACIRAKIAVWHLKEPDARDRTTWISKANHYLQLASCIIPPGRDA